MSATDGLIIPASAIKSGKRAATPSPHIDPLPFKKKLKLSGGGAASDPVVIADEDDNGSIATDDEDRDLLVDEPGELPQTDFVPGSLKFDTLPIMPVSKEQVQEQTLLSKFLEAGPSPSPTETLAYLSLAAHLRHFRGHQTPHAGSSITPEVARLYSSGRAWLVYRH